MNIEQEIIDLRIKTLEECLKILKPHSKTLLETIKPIIIQKIALTKKDYTNQKVLKAIETTQDFKLELGEYLPRMSVSMNIKVCPITKQAIKEEYITPCGHSMELSSAKLMFKTSEVINCPYVGCRQRIKRDKDLMK